MRALVLLALLPSLAAAETPRVPIRLDAAQR